MKGGCGRKKIKIAFFAPSIDPKNGWGNITGELISTYFTHFKDELNFVLYLPVSEKEKDYVKGLPYFEKIRCVLPDFTFSFRNPKKFASYFLKDFLKEKVDVVHALDFPYALSALRSTMFKKTSLVVTVQGTFSLPLYRFPDKFLFRKVYTKASVITAPSDFTIGLVRNNFTLNSDKTRVVYNGVNFKRFLEPQDTIKLRAKFGGNACKVVLGIGALKARKGFDITIGAIAKVKKEIPDVKYIIVGEGHQRKELEQLISDLNLNENVFLVGEVGGKELVQYFQMCDLYAHTPRVIDGRDSEGFGIVYLEAGAAGKPVVGSISGGVSSAVLANKTGLLVKENDIDETARAIITILKDNNLAMKLGDCGREWARKNDWNLIARQFIDLYGEVC